MSRRLPVALATDKFAKLVEQLDLFILFFWLLGFKDALSSSIKGSEGYFFFIFAQTSNNYSSVLNEEEQSGAKGL